MYGIFLFTYATKIVIYDSIDSKKLSEMYQLYNMLTAISTDVIIYWKQ